MRYPDGTESVADTEIKQNEWVFAKGAAQNSSYKSDTKIKTLNVWVVF